MIGSIVLGIGFIGIIYYVVRGTMILNKAHEEGFKELGTQPTEEKEFRFIDELEDLSPEHTLLAEDEEEESETLFYL